MTRQALIQHLQIISSLKTATAQRVRELHELEARTQTDLIAARQIDSFLDFYAEHCQREIAKLDETPG